MFASVFCHSNIFPNTVFVHYILRVVELRLQLFQRTIDFMEGNIVKLVLHLLDQLMSPEPRIRIEF